MGFCRQFRSLFWKNCLLKRRMWVQTLLEIFLPVIIMLAFVGIRNAVKIEEEPFKRHTDDMATFDPSGMAQTDLYKLNVDRIIRAGSYSGKIAIVGPAGPAMDGLLREWAQFVAPYSFVYPRQSNSEYTFNQTYTLANFTVTGWASDSELVSYIGSPEYGVGGRPRLVAALVIEQWGDSANNYHWKYKLRGNATRDISEQTSLPTSELDSVNVLQWVYENTEWTTLTRNSPVFMQIFIESFMIRMSIPPANPLANSMPSRFLQFLPFNTPPYRLDQFADFVGDSIGLLFTLVFLWPVTRIAKLLVEEKESKIKEGMKMMGLSESALFFSWWCTYALVFLVMSIIIVIVTKGSVFKYSDGGRVFIFFWFFGLATFSYAYLLSTVFSRARTASTLAAITYLVLFFPYYSIAGNRGSTGEKTAACLSAPTCFGLGAFTIIKYEAAGTGVGDGNSATNIQGFSYDSALGMLFFDIWLYILLGVYLNQVLPSEWGTQRPWYFLCTKRFWCPDAADSNSSSARLTQYDHSNPAHRNEIELAERGADAEALTGDHIEPVSADVAGRPGIKIRHLRKEYGSRLDGDTIKVAVKDFSLDCFEGQITCLLGHNGAGKSTTISMLTGLIPSTSGDALIYGRSIRSSLEVIRRDMGVCPQANILFDRLTVFEHLQLFGLIKGMDPGTVNQKATALIEELGLVEKTNVFASDLSGGMKRKLCVGIAVIGDPKFIILDEFSSGLDVLGRRLVWDLLKRRRPQSTIIFTTHYMDEADQLSDRIAMMSDGELKCCGSSLFLKNQYGVGYSLTLVKDQQAPEKHAEAESRVRECLSRHVPSYELQSAVAGEISFRLPTSSSPAFSAMFDEFDRQLVQWGISSYGISVTTLEEVFLRVGHDTTVEPAAQKKLNNEESAITPSKVHVQPAGSGSSNGHGSGSGSGSENSSRDAELKIHDDDLASILECPVNKQHLPWKHIRALYIKRYHDSMRNKRGWCWTIIIPFLVMIVGLAVVSFFASRSQQSIGLSPTQYNQPYQMPVNGLTTLANTVLTPGTYGSAQGINGIYEFASAPACTNSTNCADWLYDNFQSTIPGKAGRSWFGAIVADLSESGSQIVDRTTILFNTSSLYSTQIHLNAYNQALLRYYSGNQNAAIQSTLHPFPLTANQKTLTNSFASVFISIAFAFIPAHFIHYAVLESEVKAKHQQFISGVSAWTYHLANYLWDFTNFIVPAMLCMLCLAIFNIEQTIGENAGATVLLIILYGLSIISFCYMCSFMFSNHSSAQNAMLIFFVLIGAFLTVVSIILDILPSTRDINKPLKYVYRLFPSFCLGEGLANLIVRSSVTAFGSPRGIWDMEVVGYPMIFMTWEIFAYFAIVLVVEYITATPELFKYFTPAAARMSKDDPEQAKLIEDEDVRAERERVEQMIASGGEKDYVTLHGVRKVYASLFDSTMKTAVHNLSIGIKTGECFGFLGVNGAGKTTTLKVLTNDIYPTSGNAYINGINIMTHQSSVRQYIGYCSQFDSLMANLSAREHLTLFARIKGIDESVIPGMVDRLIKRIALQPGIEDKPSAGYSGGNKRKLCIGIALVGNGGVLFLDEVSSGVDPSSQRMLWDLISASTKNRAIVLTSHSMAETEALCNKIGIMVAGRLKCFGTPQHLRSLYGQGYQIDINLVPDQGQEGSGAASEFSQLVRRWVKATWPASAELEIHDTNLKFRIEKQQPINAPAHELASGDGPIEWSHISQSIDQPIAPSGEQAVVTIGRMFHILERVKTALRVREYSASEMTLEQIFLHFANTDPNQIEQKQ